jgi:hypothetical protein
MFGLTYFELMRIAYANKLPIIYYYKVFKVIYDKTTYKNKKFVNKNL